MLGGLLLGLKEGRVSGLGTGQVGTQQAQGVS